MNHIEPRILFGDIEHIVFIHEQYFIMSILCSEVDL